MGTSTPPNLTIQIIWFAYLGRNKIIRVSMCPRESPWEKEKQGELQQAATLYAVEAMNGMMRSNFGESSTRSYRIALSKFFLSMSCDVRNGANNRSESLFEFIRPLV